MKKILLVIGADGFRDEEYFEPLEIFKNAGFKTITASNKAVAISKIDKKEVNADILFNDASPDDYDAVCYIGGPGAEIFLDHTFAKNFAWDMYNKGKLVTAICIAPVILANSGLLTGKKATVWQGGKKQLCEGRCLYQSEGVAVDGRIITASGPNFAAEFAKTIVEKLNCNV